jgi:hypothetical protein
MDEPEQPDQDTVIARVYLTPCTAIAASLDQVLESED